MNSNYHLSDDSVLTELFRDVSSVGRRDKDAILQMLLNFSTALSLTEKAGNSIRALETGSGFSTRVFEFLLRGFPASTLTSIDFGGEGALVANSRSVTWSGESQDVKLNLIQAPSIDLEDLEQAWGLTGELNWDNRALAASDLEPFIDYRHDDRRVSEFESYVGERVSPAAVLRLVRDLGKGQANYLLSRRYQGDEFETLGHTRVPACLDGLMADLQPDLIFLDSGEFSTLAEFLVVDELAKAGAILVVQDILFPKSVKGFIIGGFVLNSPRWQMLWSDRSTAQGIFVAKRIG
jgi:hypothetical protein